LNRSAEEQQLKYATSKLWLTKATLIINQKDLTMHRDLVLTKNPE